jgi:hypothetical protein
MRRLAMLSGLAMGARHPGLYVAVNSIITEVDLHGIVVSIVTVRTRLKCYSFPFFRWLLPAPEQLRFVSRSLTSESDPLGPAEKQEFEKQSLHCGQSKKGKALEMRMK